MRYACGSAVICDTLAVAKHICYDQNLEIKAVTLDGTLIHKNGMITGGQMGSNQAVRWEEKELDGKDESANGNYVHGSIDSIPSMPALRKVKDSLVSELTDLQRQRKTNSDEDEARMGIARLTSKLKTLRDQTVGYS